MWMDDILFVALPVILIVICVVYFVVSGILSMKRKKLRTVQAQVLTKKIKRPYVPSLANAGVSGVNWYEFYAVFQTEKGEKLELQLPKEVYENIEEGDKGQLSFKDYHFISFDKNSCFSV